MPLDLTPTTYTTGTVSIGAAGLILTGAGTNWLTAGIRPGDRLELRGLVARIASVDTATQITLTLPWPGAAVAASPYAIERIDDEARAFAAMNQLNQSLVGGNLLSLAGIPGAANQMPFWIGEGVMQAAGLTSQARTLLASALLARDGNNLVTGADARLTGGAVQTSPTSADWGQVLTFGGFGQGARIGYTGNLDEISVPGIYGLSNTVTISPPGIVAASINGSDLHHYTYDGNNHCQVLYVRGGGGRAVRLDPAPDQRGQGRLAHGL